MEYLHLGYTILIIMIYLLGLLRRKRMILIWLLRNLGLGLARKDLEMRLLDRRSLMMMILLRKFRINIGKKRREKCLKILQHSNQGSLGLETRRTKHLALVPITMVKKTIGIKGHIIFFLQIFDVFHNYVLSINLSLSTFTSAF